MYKQAVKVGLRIQSSRGPLTVEQVMSLKIPSLEVLLESLAEQMGKSNNDLLSFMDTTSKVDPLIELSFNIVKDIYLDKKKEEMLQSSSAEIKREEQELLAISAEQESAALRNDPEAVKARLAEIQERKKLLNL